MEFLMKKFNYYINRNRNINRGYRKLSVWKEAISLFAFVRKKLKLLHKLSFKVRAQIEDSILSVSSNIAEGYCRRYLKEQIQFNSISLSSLGENYTQILALFTSKDLSEEWFNKYDKMHYSLENKLIKFNESLLKKLKGNENWNTDYNLNIKESENEYYHLNSTTQSSNHPSNPAILQSCNPPSSYFYQCFTCKKKWDADFIESNFHYLCPNCENKNLPGNPLIGVLQVFYDYNSLKAKYSKNFFRKIKTGNVFFYPDLLPIRKKLNLSLFDSLSLPQNSLNKIKFASENEIYLLDETHNPTFSYKDRASILVAAKAIEIGKTTICTASTGNAASSISGICATLGLKSKIFVPKNIPDEKLLQIKIYGADVQKVAGNYDDAFDLAIEKSKQKNWYNRNTAYNPLTIEGKKSAAFDILLQMNFQIPDKIFVPTGDGVIISGIYKGFFDLLKLNIIEKIPQLIAVQSEGSSAIIDYLQNRKFILKESNTIADSISVNAPRNLYLATDCIEKSNGFGIKVNDDEILKSEKYIGNKFGIFVEPSAAAAWAGFEKYCNSTPKKNEKNVVILTGCGLKDSKSAEKAVNI